MRDPWALVTEDAGNKVLDPLRLGFLVGFLTMIGLEIYATVWRGQSFSIGECGAGIGAYLTGAGASLWMSSKQVDS